MLHLGLGILQFFTFASWAVVGLCVNHHLLQIETYLMKDVLIYGYNDKSLGVGLILCEFKRILIVASSLWSMI